MYINLKERGQNEEGIIVYRLESCACNNLFRVERIPTCPTLLPSLI